MAMKFASGTHVPRTAPAASLWADAASPRAGPHAITAHDTTRRTSTSGSFREQGCAVPVCPASFVRRISATFARGREGAISATITNRDT
jgi:hypothetical protein